MSLLVALLTVLVLQTAPPDNVNIWQGRNAEIEQCLAEAKVARLEDVPIGVTKPRRAMLEPGGCARAFAWKPLQPAYYSGFWESYKSEVAAYELDKALELNMVPVVVERKVNGLTGAAILWLYGVRSWEQILPLPKPAAWPLQLVRMKMFDCLIGNGDRNKGNMLVDQAWNLYLIDHSRGFVHGQAAAAAVDIPERRSRAMAAHAGAGRSRTHRAAREVDRSASDSGDPAAA